MQNLNSVLVTEVTNENINELWEKILKDVEKSSFIALDAEMSGLGPRKLTMASNLEERYNAIRSAACSRAIISLGLACFSSIIPDSLNENSEHPDITEKNHSVKYDVAVFNILLLCSEPYIIDPNAVTFLLEHGFDFNKQFSMGVRYYKGNDRKSITGKSHCMRNLFAEIICRRKPLILHNGLTDLVYMYQCFYAECPATLTAFMADVSEIFPSGVYDTKYIAEFLDRTPASFLLYLFKNSLLLNDKLYLNGKNHVATEYGDNTDFSSLVNLSDVSNRNSVNSIDTPICQKYSAYGWCLAGSSCKKNHCIDAIIQAHQTKKSRKRKQQPNEANIENNKKVTKSYTDNLSAETNDSKTDTMMSDESLTHTETCTQANKPSTKGHRAGSDAFMTGYIFAVFIVSRLESGAESAVGKSNDSCKKYSKSIPYLSNKLQHSIANKLYLSGKNIPLPVCKSQYTKTSKNHDEKLIKVYIK